MTIKKWSLTMINDDKLLKSGFKRCWASRNGLERCGTVRDGEGRWGTVGTVKDGEGRECHDDETVMDYG